LLVLALSVLEGLVILEHGPFQGEDLTVPHTPKIISLAGFGSVPLSLVGSGLDLIVGDLLEDFSLALGLDVGDGLFHAATAHRRKVRINSRVQTVRVGFGLVLGLLVPMPLGREVGRGHRVVLAVGDLSLDLVGVKLTLVVEVFVGVQGHQRVETAHDAGVVVGVALPHP